jgi:murein L,D-transpeptidase YcbB/YkuD
MDVLLTDAFLAMARDLKHGRIRQAKVTKEDSLQVAFLTDTLSAGDIRSYLKVQEPRYREYSLLREALNNILDSLDVSDRKLLLAGRTIDSAEAHRKIQCIEVNMERWRNENADLDHIYTWVNIPSYMFYVFDNHKVVLQSAVVVGKPSTPTLTFSSNIECLTIFPYWYMPRKIAVREYLPVIKRDTSFLSRNNFDVLDRQGKIQNPKTIDWKRYNEDNFPFTLRQREGKENSLGIIKFVFDNPYAIFLHDTNAKKLFKHKVRAYSHGCIRLEKAVEFAHYLVGGNRSAVSAKTLNKFLGDQKRQTITLNQSIPIHIRYLTCEVRDGKLFFYPDIYKKDVNLVNIIYDQETL